MRNESKNIKLRSIEDKTEELDSSNIIRDKIKNI
jgi:hypothetical protein